MAVFVFKALFDEEVYVSGLIEKLRSLFLFLSCTLWGLMRPRHQYLSRTHYHLDSFRSHIRCLHSGTQMYLRTQVHTGTQVHTCTQVQVHTITWIAFTLTSDTFTDDLSGFDNIMAIVMMAMLMVLEILVITSINKSSL